MTTTKARCTACGRTMRPARNTTIEAETVHQAHGLCGRDYTAWIRNGRPDLGHEEPMPEPNDSALLGFLAARRRRGIPATGLAVAS